MDRESDTHVTGVREKDLTYTIPQKSFQGANLEIMMPFHLSGGAFI